jgi:REP element-mobilizing transposase RayT
MYFVTVCVQDRVCLFGDVAEDAITLTTPGLMVESWWHAISMRFSGTTLDAMVVMPNHVHGIVVIETTGDQAASEAGDKGRHIGLPLPDEQDFVGADR